MAKSKETFEKRRKEMNKIKARQDKMQKMEERKAAAKKGKTLNDMLAYVDENGNLVSAPPSPHN